MAAANTTEPSCSGALSSPQPPQAATAAAPKLATQAATPQPDTELSRAIRNCDIAQSRRDEAEARLAAKKQAPRKAYQGFRTVSQARKISALQDDLDRCVEAYFCAERAHAAAVDAAVCQAEAEAQQIREAYEATLAERARLRELGPEGVRADWEAKIFAREQGRAERRLFRREHHRTTGPDGSEEFALRQADGVGFRTVGKWGLPEVWETKLERMETRRRRSWKRAQDSGSWAARETRVGGG